MPVLGHAFFGLATAMASLPTRGIPKRASFWLPVIVALAYLPDITAQLLLLAGLTAWSPTCHSMVLIAPASLIVAALLRWLFQIRWRRGLVIAVASILLHEAADLLVGGHRLLLWWPISNRRVSFAPRETDLSLTREALIFGGVLLGLVAIRWLWSRRGVRGWGAGFQPVCPQPGWLRHKVEAGGITAVIIVSAVATQYLRDIREHQLAQAWVMINQKQYTPALGLLGEAERWPSTARPGRIDYARAEAYTNLGDRPKAEEYYLRSYRADPSYFWVLADLAAFYASSDEPLEVRRLRAAPYLRRLASEFAAEKALPRCMAGLERKLYDTSTRPVSRTD